VLQFSLFLRQQRDGRQRDIGMFEAGAGQMNRPTVASTPVTGCNSCNKGLRHSPENLRIFHPLSGHGYVPEQGWCHEILSQKGTGAAPVSSCSKTPTSK
jgi:hypothetical protein